MQGCTIQRKSTEVSKACFAPIFRAEWYAKIENSTLLPACIIVVFYSAYSSALKMEAASYYETSVFSVYTALYPRRWNAVRLRASIKSVQSQVALQYPRCFNSVSPSHCWRHHLSGFVRCGLARPVCRSRSYTNAVKPSAVEPVAPPSTPNPWRP
jgi:hypothetical protein